MRDEEEEEEEESEPPERKYRIWLRFFFFFVLKTVLLRRASPVKQPKGLFPAKTRTWLQEMQKFEGGFTTRNWSIGQPGTVITQKINHDTVFERRCALIIV